MLTLLQNLAERAGILVAVTKTGTAFVLALLLFVVLRAGGILGVQGWLADRHEHSRRRARRLMRRAEDPKTDARKRLDLRLAGQDIWDEANAVTRDRVKALIFCQWSSLLLIAGGAIISVMRPFDTLGGATFTAAWFALFALFLVRVFPILWLALMHGRPSATKNAKRVDTGVLEARDADESEQGRKRVALSADKGSAPDPDELIDDELDDPGEVRRNSK